MKPVSTSTETVTEQTRRVIARFYELAAAGDAATLIEECIHPELVLDEPPYLPHAGTWHGAETLLTVALPAALTVLDFTTIEVVSITADGDQGFAVVQVQVVDRPDRVVFAEQWTVREGRISAFRPFIYDPAPVLDRVGRITTQ